ncbi:hypothetical protein RFI_23767 [Reticulomyxa filosa]|uniref:MRH domain-containing protein n=1 Tax=Reticulomyxa filosa TaxID=46433 RepID=X6MKJ4_RETFI|nr:hypothetical protein RFI_23767 [Reticulomyxa filosa]|eukprot:ETO13600.1 hypothetical protein RFI_23767 [Reticulomyxa filosa]
MVTPVKIVTVLFLKVCVVPCEFKLQGVLKMIKDIIPILTLFWSFWLWKVRCDSCEWVASLGLTYDLTPLQLTKGQQLQYYVVKDERYEDNATMSDQFVYKFNVCGKMLSVPSECKGSTFKWCQNIDLTTKTCSNEVALQGTGYAYQIRQTSSTSYVCHQLSNVHSNYTKLELLDPDEPAKGVVLIYKDGEWCDQYTTTKTYTHMKKTNREFRLRLECENNYYNIPDEEQVVENKCTYNVTMQSVYGCPTQCGIYGHSLCNGNGICSYDWTNKNAGCFCYWNRKGSTCEEESGAGEYLGVQPDRTKDKYMHTFQSLVSWHTDSGTDTASFVNVTYDYKLLHLAQGAYQTNDSVNPFLYYWNFLGTVPWSSLPISCQNAVNPCNVTKNPGCTNLGSNGETNGTAFQINRNNQNCNLLARGDVYSWNLYDSQHPARGVSFTYFDGGYCGNAHV